MSDPNVICEGNRYYTYVCSYLYGTYGYIYLGGIKTYVECNTPKDGAVTRLYFWPDSVYLKLVSRKFKLTIKDSLIITEEFNTFRSKFGRYINNKSQSPVDSTFNLSSVIKDFYIRKYKG